MAKPKKPARDERKPVSARFNAHELELLKAGAAASDRSVATFVREEALKAARSACRRRGKSSGGNP
jgi:uncharacterized protein (DUF1778 family)